MNVEMDDGLRLNLLGAPRISLRGVQLSFGRRKALALLAYLAMSGRPAAREVLANLLVDETTDNLARQHVRNALVDLSSQIGDYLVVSRQMVAFNRALPYWLDVEEFQRLVSQGIASGAGRALTEAAALYSGDFLQGFALRHAPAFDEWLDAERHRLRGLAAQAVHLLLDRAEEAGDTVSGLAIAQHLLTIEPLSEPSAIDERLRAQPAVVPHNLPAAPERDRDAPRELAILIERLADPACRLIVLLGPDELEKTRLMLQAMAHYRSLMGTPNPFRDGIYLIPSARARQRGAAEEHLRARSQLAIAIGQALGIGTGGADDPAVELLTRLGDQAMLLVLDSLAPAESEVDLVHAILNRAPQVKLIVAAHEPLYLQEEWVLDIGRSGLS
jgi:hypothetical protein